MLQLKASQHILYCTSTEMFAILNLSVQSTHTSATRVSVLITYNSKRATDNTTTAGINCEEQ